MNTLTTQGQNLQRERIVMEEKPGKRCTFGGSMREMPDPWKQPPTDVPRDSKPRGIVGYGGHLPRVRPEFQGPMASEAQSAFDPPYKLVRNLKTGKQSLYRLDGPTAEAIPLDPALDPSAQEAQARLEAVLDESQNQSGRTLPKTRARRIPGRVEASLRALGYIE